MCGSEVFTRHTIAPLPPLASPPLTHVDSAGRHNILRCHFCLCERSTSRILSAQGSLALRTELCPLAYCLSCHDCFFFFFFCIISLRNIGYTNDNCSKQNKPCMVVTIYQCECRHILTLDFVWWFWLLEMSI